jgi:REG-2-like HAD superfamily hydrolase
MPLRAVFLDIGETLITTTVSRFEVYARAARSRGREIDEGAMKKLMGRAHHTLPRTIDGAHRYTDPWFRAFIARVFGDELGFRGAPLEEITQELFDHFETANSFRVFSGAEALFDALREQGLVVGVISNWTARLPQLLASLGWEDRFEPILCSAVEGIEKPEPEIFRRALARAGVEAGEALHVGDDPELDVAGARGAGLAAVRVDHFTDAPHDGGNGDPAAAPCVYGLDELRSFILERVS